MELLQNETIADFIDHMTNELGEKEVPGTPYTLLNYVHGRCHLFAKSLHEELGYKMEFLWDVDAWIEGYDEATSVLVHAYCLNENGEMIDARGKLDSDVLEISYEYNEAYYEKTTLEKIQKDIDEEVLFDGEPNELDNLKKFIRENISIYQ